MSNASNDLPLGPGKIVGLYFSAHWCPPCRAFTPALSKWYTAFKATHPEFELIFVSSDRNEEQFNEYWKEMSFPALQFKDQQFKMKLAQKCSVQGIPTLALLDGETGEVITTKGRERVMTDPQGAQFPWRPKPLTDQLHGPLVNGKGESKEFKDLVAPGTTLGIYFSAHWCGPCRTVTPLLTKKYEELKAEGRAFEVIFVSLDRTEKDFEGYLGSMPWWALPFGDDPRKELLEDEFEVSGIPTLVLLRDGKLKVNVAAEAPEQTAARLLNFAMMIKYRPPVDLAQFQIDLANGAQETILPFIKWVLTQQSDLQKRAYVGYHMMPVALPEEMRAAPDDETYQLTQELSALQQEFAVLHRGVDAIRSEGRDLASLKAEVDRLADDKDKLTEHLSQRRERSANIPRDLLEASLKLQGAKDSAAELSTQLQVQRRQMEAAEQKLQRLKMRINTSRSGQADGNLLGTLEKTVEELKYGVMERLPKELERRQTRLRVLEQAASCTEADFGRMEEERAGLEVEIAELRRRKEQLQKELQQSKEYQSLRQQQQMAQMVERKKDEISGKVRRLEDKRDGLMRQYERLVEELGLQQEAGGQGGGVGEEELRVKQAEIRGKLDEFKQKKRALDEVRAELLVLGRTEEVLDRTAQDLRFRVRNMEAQQGVEGATEMETDLQKVSEAKSTVDEEKGATLGSISAMVAAINAKIKTRQDQLVPKIKELKELRARVTEAETVRDRIDQESGAALGKLESEVDKGMQEYLEMEGRYHQLAAQMGVLDALIRARVTNPAEAKALEDRLKARVQVLEADNGQLQSRFNDAQGQEQLVPEQKAMLEALKSLLTAKMQANANRGGVAPSNVGMAPATELTYGNANVLTF